MKLNIIHRRVSTTIANTLFFVNNELIIVNCFNNSIKKTIYLSYTDLLNKLRSILQCNRLSNYIIFNIDKNKIKIIRKCIKLYTSYSALLKHVLKNVYRFLIIIIGILLTTVVRGRDVITRE